LIFTIIFAPSSTAWSWETHSNIAEAVYYGLPPEIQNNLNLELMKNASNDPDEKFKDFTYHSYPKSYEKAKTWLDKGKTAYDKGEYGEASTDYGIASHYISDTFSAPHGVSKEASSDHTKYEDTSSKLKPVATYKSGDLNTILQEGYTQGGGSWNEWLQTKNSDIIQKNLNDGASASLSAIQDSINSTASPNLISSLYSFILNIFNIH
jgi:hypothetical protein